MLQKECHADTEGGRDPQRDEQPEDAHKVHAQNEQLEDEQKNRVTKDSRVLHTYTDVREVRIETVQNREGAQQLAAFQNGRRIDDSTSYEPVEDLQTITDRGDLSAKEITHNRFALSQRGDITKTAQHDVNKNIENAKARHLQIGFAHLASHHMERRQAVQECEEEQGTQCLVDLRGYEIFAYTTQCSGHISVSLFATLRQGRRTTVRLKVTTRTAQPQRK